MINDRGSVSHEEDTHRKGRMESPQIKKAFFQTLRQRELKSDPPKVNFAKGNLFE